jgi:hypothetical protein
MHLGNTLNIGKDLLGPTHCSVRSNSILEQARGHASLDWSGPPSQFPLHARSWALFKPCAKADCQRCVLTVPAAALTRATSLLASTCSTCSHFPCAPPCTLPVALIRLKLRQSLACLLLSLATQRYCRRPCTLLHFAPTTSVVTKSLPKSTTSLSPSRALL